MMRSLVHLWLQEIE